MRERTSSRQIADQFRNPGADFPIGSGGALAGAMAASLLAKACHAHLDTCRSRRAKEGLIGIRDRALSLHRDLLALVEHEGQASRAIEDARSASGVSEVDEQRRLRAMLFASEVPLRTADSCNALLAMSLYALGRAGIKAIAELGTAAALAFAGVVGGTLGARKALANIPSGKEIGAEAARKRAERVFREAEAIRSQVMDRVRQHLP